jgi:hypothetical protein
VPLRMIHLQASCRGGALIEVTFDCYLTKK